MNISIRELQNFKFTGIANVNPTRPSTALEFDATLPTVYRIIAYNSALSEGSALPNDTAVLTSDSSFVYIKPTTDPTLVTTTDPIDGAKKILMPLSCNYNLNNIDIDKLYGISDLIYDLEKIII
jgi:hypothetical protein